jgi:hypothetical protein
MQLTAADEPLWSAAAWVGITKNSTGQWGDDSGPLSNLPWCPNEPNNNAKDGAESCASLLTACSSDGNALLNDFACNKLARVVCAAAEMSDCGECIENALVSGLSKVAPVSACQCLALLCKFSVSPSHVAL